MKLLTDLWMVASCVLLVLMLLEQFVYHDNLAAIGAGICMWFSFGIWCVLLAVGRRLRR